MWVECVPNFSDGVDSLVLSRLREACRLPQVKVLGLEGDADHNRSVLTMVGPGEAVQEAAFRLTQVAVDMIDLRKQKGVHPRMGAVDVIPFIPLFNTPMTYAIDCARRLGERIGQELSVPVYLYEQAATTPGRKNLADVRRGEFEGLPGRMANDPPDFGPSRPHPTAGAVAVGARRPLIAFNVYLNTQDLSIADRVAKAVRGSSGGLVGVKAMAMDTIQKGRVQVSMNLVDYPKTRLPQALELIRQEAHRYGVSVSDTELVGFMPIQAVVDTVRQYLQLNDFSPDDILEMALARSDSG